MGWKAYDDAPNLLYGKQERYRCVRNVSSWIRLKKTLPTIAKNDWAVAFCYTWENTVIEILFCKLDGHSSTIVCRVVRASDV